MVSNTKAREHQLSHQKSSVDGHHPVVVLATCDVERERKGKGKRGEVGVRVFKFEHEWQVARSVSHATN